MVGNTGAAGGGAEFGSPGRGERELPRPLGSRYFDGELS
jgi:hypothetical protein